jgi:hypothetical protein
MYEIGVGTIYGSNKSLLVPDQNKVIKRNIFEQLKEIIEKGEISTYNSDILLMEKVSLILYYYYKELDYNFSIKDCYLPRFDLIYPIDLKELRDKVYSFRAIHYYKRKKIVPSLINKMVEEALRENQQIPELNHIGDFPPFEELFKVVNILLKNGYNEIKEHHLPCPDKSIIAAKEFYEQNRKLNLRETRIFQFSNEQAKSYIETFFKHLESCYREFVEDCFPSFKDEFLFFTSMPHEYFFYMKDSDVLKWGMFGYRSSKNGKIRINYTQDSSDDEAFKKDEITTLRGFSLDNILHNGYSYDLIQTVDEINTPEVDEFCIIRNWVYKLLKDDMEKIFNQNED